MFRSFSSAALSGCGIIPKTFFLLLVIPAIFKIEPFGFEKSSTVLSSLEYWKRIWSLSWIDLRTSSAAKKRPSPWAIGIFKALLLSKSVEIAADLETGFKKTFLQIFDQSIVSQPKVGFTTVC